MKKIMRVIGAFLILFVVALIARAIFELNNWPHQVWPNFIGILACIGFWWLTRPKIDADTKGS